MILLFCRLLTFRASVQFQGSQCGICAEQSITGTGFSTDTSDFPTNRHPTNAPYSRNIFLTELDRSDQPSHYRNIDPLFELQFWPGSHLYQIKLGLVLVLYYQCCYQYHMPYRAPFGIRLFAAVPLFLCLVMDWLFSQRVITLLSQLGKFQYSTHYLSLWHTLIQISLYCHSISC